MRLNDLLKTAVDQGASDLHLKVGGRPMMRLRGALLPCSDVKVDIDEMDGFAGAVLTGGVRQKFEQSREADLAYSVSGLSRFRCNVYQQRARSAWSSA